MLVHRLADSEELPSAFRTAVACTKLAIETSAFSFWFAADLHQLHGDGWKTHDSGVAMNQSGGSGGARNHGDGNSSLGGILLDWWREHEQHIRRPMLAQTQAKERALAQGMAHGGGSSMVAQTNDSDIHVQRRFIESLLLRKCRTKRSFKKKLIEKMRIVVKNRILMKFAFDPDMRPIPIDQKPFHMDEAGYAARNTLALTGAFIVPLVENHAATRKRWSLISRSTL